MLDAGQPAWAGVVERLLSPDGQVLIFDGHPLDNLWQRESDSFQLRPDDSSYFSSEPNENPGFPASVVIQETDNAPGRPKMLERYWRPGEVIGALASAGLQYVHSDEYPDPYWNQFRNVPKETAARLPHTYSVVMKKRRA